MYSEGRRSPIPGLGRAIRLVMPRPQPGSLSSALYVTGSGTNRDSLRSFQNRFEYPAKWCPVLADRTPGLIPTNSTRKPGRMRSFSRSFDQTGDESCECLLLMAQCNHGSKVLAVGAAHAEGQHST